MVRQDPWSGPFQILKPERDVTWHRSRDSGLTIASASHHLPGLSSPNTSDCYQCHRDAEGGLPSKEGMSTCCGPALSSTPCIANIARWRLDQLEGNCTVIFFEIFLCGYVLHPSVLCTVCLCFADMPNSPK